jgi:hypothetical protein
MTGLFIAVTVIPLGGWALISVPAVGKAMDRFIVSRPKLAEFLGGWDEDAKKAPAGATAGAENLLNNNIYPSIVSNRLGIRKVETK